MSTMNQIEQSEDSTPTDAPKIQKPTVCVFCGAYPGRSPAHLEAARALARAFHKHGINLVYGGGDAGIMGEVARTLVSLSGPDAVHGIIPEALLAYERQSTDAGGTTSGKTKLSTDENLYGRTTVVKDMHARKHLMARQVIESGPGSGFVALSGGYGTMEELMEVVTWNQLGIHTRGVVLFNVEGYYDGLLSWVKNAVAAGFIVEGNADIMVEAKTAEEVVEKLRDYRVAGGVYNLHWGDK